MIKRNVRHRVRLPSPHHDGLSNPGTVGGWPPAAAQEPSQRLRCSTRDGNGSDQRKYGKGCRCVGRLAIHCRAVSRPCPLSSRNASKSRRGPRAASPGRMPRATVADGHEAVVDEGGEVEPTPGDQAVRGGEPRIALDELQLAVPLIALELGVGQPEQPHPPEEPQSQVPHLGVPVGDMVACIAHAGGGAPDDALGEMEEGCLPPVEVGVIATEQVVRPGDPFPPAACRSRPR